MTTTLPELVQQAFKERQQLIDEAIESHLSDIFAKRFPDGGIDNAQLERRQYIRAGKEEYLIDGEVVLVAEWAHDELIITIPTGD